MKARVLVVDDERDYLDLVEFSLSQAGFEVVTAANGLQALHQARRLLPDVIVLDLMLPDIDGVAVCEILRAQPSTRQVPVIVLSALERKLAPGGGASIECSRYLLKGSDLTALAEEVRVAAEQQQMALRARLDTSEEALQGRVDVEPLP